MMNDEYNELFCPIKNKNVIINDNSPGHKCLDYHDCEKNHGGCKNKRFYNKKDN